MADKDLEKLQSNLNAAKDERQNLEKQLTESSDQRMNAFEDKLATLREGVVNSPAEKTIETLRRTIKEQEIRMALLNTELGSQSAKLLFLQEQNEHLKKSLVALQTTAEQEEEFISNMLFKRIDSLKNEKKDLLLKVEAEEEIITKQLQEKLSKLQKEKIQMEISLEQEQEAMVNRLQKQLDEMRASESPRRSRMPSADYKFEKRTNSISSSFSEIPISNQVVEMMRAEVEFNSQKNNALKAKIYEQTTIFNTWASAACDEYAKIYVMATKKQDVASFPPILNLPTLTSPESVSPVVLTGGTLASGLLSRSSSAQIPQSPMSAIRLSARHY